MKWKTKQALWIAIYFVMIFAPLLILLLAPRPAGRTFWRELSVALGFAGLSLMGLQFIPAARLPFLSEVFPMDTLYDYHHKLSIAAFVLALSHPVILFIQNPYTLRLLNIFNAPWRARAGLTSAVALILLVLTSVKRLSLKLSYETWRLLHDVLSIIIIALAFYHIYNVNYYMSVPIQRWLWGLLGILWGLTIVYIRVIKPLQLLRHPYEVAEVIAERGNTWSLNLKPVGHAGRKFRAGQVAWLSIGHSPFLIEEHPFSYASSDEDSEMVGFAIKELGDFTATIGSLKPGTRVYIDGPYGMFDLDKHPDRNYIFIAGGIGSAPIMSMLRTLADRNDQRQLQFFYGNPNYESIIFREELESLQECLNLDVIHVLDSPEEAWEGERGYITLDVLKRHLMCEHQRCSYFICGPLPMIESVERCLMQLAVSRQDMHEMARKRAFETTRKQIYSENYKMA